MEQSVDTERRERRRPLFVIALAVAIGALLFGVAGGSDSEVQPRVVEGWARPNDTGTSVGLFRSIEDDEGEGYVVAGARWSGPDDSWHDGAVGPTCIGTDVTLFTEVELGVVDVTSPDGTRWTHVVWLRCL